MSTLRSILVVIGIILGIVILFLITFVVIPVLLFRLNVYLTNLMGIEVSREILYIVTMVEYIFLFGGIRVATGD